VPPHHWRRSWPHHAPPSLEEESGSVRHKEDASLPLGEREGHMKGPNMARGGE
jgi:hypothetical protein